MHSGWLKMTGCMTPLAGNRGMAAGTASMADSREMAIAKINWLADVLRLQLHSITG